jgi:hypothetical protein
MNWLLPHILPPPHSVSSTETHRETDKERQFADERGGDGGGGAKSDNSEKVWSFTNPSLLSACIHVIIIFPI